MKTFAEQDNRLAGITWVPGAGGCSNVYALHGGRTLIDAGNMFGLVDELLDLGPLKQLERVILTHGHVDHVGGVGEIFQSATPDLLLHPGTLQCLRTLQPPFPQFIDALEADGKLRLLSHGETIEGNPELLAIHTPGHTAGDLCIFERGSGALFCGDVLPPKGGRASDFRVEPDADRGGSLEDSLDSLRRLLRLPVKHLFPGHGEPLFQKGGDHIKFTLLSIHRSLNPDHPEKAWLAMASDLLAAGFEEEARQCVRKSTGLPGDAEEVKRILSDLRLR